MADGGYGAGVNNTSVKLSQQSRDALLGYVQAVMDNHGHHNEFINKLTKIDIAYARYKALANSTGGVDRESSQTECGLNLDEITVPVVVSHVDSYVGYLAEVYLSGYPIFPVVSPPKDRVEAEALQAIIDDHAMRGRYARQFLMNFYDAVKYNLCAVETEWCEFDNFLIPTGYEQLRSGAGKTPQPEMQSINKVTRLSPYNLVFDRRVAPVDVPTVGAFAGYVEAISNIELARRLDYYKRTGNSYHTNQAFKAGMPSAAGTGASAMPYVLGHYVEAPQISNLLTAPRLTNGSIQDWDVWFLGNQNKNLANKIREYSDLYEHITLYCRIIPKMYGIFNDASSMPQVWKLCIVNSQYIVYAARVYSIYNTLPIYFSQPREDGMELQTVSVAEGAIDFQETASKLFGIRLNSARRSVMDRAIYDSSMINPSHLNSPIPAPKIPLRDTVNTLSGKKISDAYYQIPFDSRGTETVVQDVAATLRLSEQLNGINQPFQGQFQKGNKTRKEWVDTMEGAANRFRLSALSMEYQMFLPVKEQIKMNIFQFGAEGTYQSMHTGQEYKVDAQMLEQIRQKIKVFKIADGFHPAEKLAATDVLTVGMQMLGNSPVLQASLGPMLPNMWAHLMSLGGVTGIEQYLPAAPATGAPAATAPPAPATVPPTV